MSKKETKKPAQPAKTKGRAPSDNSQSLRTEANKRRRIEKQAKVKLAKQSQMGAIQTTAVLDPAYVRWLKQQALKRKDAARQAERRAPAKPMFSLQARAHLSGVV